MQRPFTLSFVVIFIFNFTSLFGDVLAQEKCVNPKCDEMISVGVAIQKYWPNEKGILSLNIEDHVKIYSKEAGKNRDMLRVEVRGKRGYINKKFIRETSVRHKTEDLIIVPTEFDPGATSTRGLSGDDPAEVSLGQVTQEAPGVVSTQGLPNIDSRVTGPEVTDDDILTQGDPHQASTQGVPYQDPTPGAPNPPPNLEGTPQKGPTLGAPNPVPTLEGTPQKGPTLGAPNPAPTLEGTPQKGPTLGAPNPAPTLEGTPQKGPMLGAPNPSPTMEGTPQKGPTLGTPNPAPTLEGTPQKGPMLGAPNPAPTLEGTPQKGPMLGAPNPAPTMEGTPQKGPNLGAPNLTPTMEGSHKASVGGAEVTLDSFIPTTLRMLGGEGAEGRVLQGLVKTVPQGSSPTEGARFSTQGESPKAGDNEDEGNGNEGEENGSESFPQDDPLLQLLPQGDGGGTPLTNELDIGLGITINTPKEGPHSIGNHPRGNGPLPHMEHPYREDIPVAMEDIIHLPVNPGSHESLSPSPGGQLPILEPPTEKIPLENTTSEISSTENTPIENTSEVSSTENTTAELSSTEKTTSNESSTEKSSPEISSTEKTISGISSTEKTTSDQSSTEKTSPEISTEKTISGISSTEKTISGISSTEKTTSDQSSTEKTSPEISTEKTTSDESYTEKTSPELSSTEKTISGISSTENTPIENTSKVSSTENTISGLSSMERTTPELSSSEKTTSEVSSIKKMTPEVSSIEKIIPELSSSEKTSSMIPSTENMPIENTSVVSSTETTSDKYPTRSTPSSDYSFKHFSDLSSTEKTTSDLIKTAPSDDYTSDFSTGITSENPPSEESFPTESPPEVLNESDNGTALSDRVISAISLLLNEEMAMAVKTVFAQPNMSAGTLTLLLVMGGTLFLLYVSHMIMVKRSRETPLLRTLNHLDREHRILAQEHTTLKRQMAASNGQIKSMSGVSAPEMEEVKRCYEEQQGRLEEELCTVRARNQQLEGDVEVLTANQDELHRMLNELLADQRERSSFEDSVNSLQQMLDDQREVVENLTSDLALKTRLNDELRSEVKNGKTKMNKLDYQIEQLSRSLEEATTAKQGLGTRLAEEVASLASLRAVNDALRLEMDRLLAEAETRTGEGTRLANVAKELKQSLTLKEAECQVSRECLKKLRLVSACNGNDVEARLQEVFQIVETKARLVASEEELASLRSELEEARVRERASSARVDSLEQEAVKVQGEVAHLQKDRDGAVAKLNVLTHHFEEKETQLKKELECQGGLLQDAEGSASLISNRIRSYEVELSSCRSQIAGLRAEIEEQKESHKLTLTKEEKKGHDSWMAARAAERRQEELRQENAQLRQKLTQVQKDSEHHSLLLKAQAKRSDANGSLSSPTPLEGELSSLDMDGGLPPLPMMPPFPPGRPPLPPRGLIPGLPPPPPHLFGPPLPPPPPDRRLPPAGRMASPQGYDRYSPPDSDYSDYSPAGRGGDVPPPRRYPRRDRRSPSPAGERRSPARWFTHSPPPPHGFPKQRRSPQGPQGDFYDGESSRGIINPSKGKKTSTPVGASDR